MQNFLNISTYPNLKEWPTLIKIDICYKEIFFLLRVAFNTNYFAYILSQLLFHWITNKAIYVYTYLPCFLVIRYSFCIQNYIPLYFFYFIQWFTHIVYYHNYTNLTVIFQSYFLFLENCRLIVMKWIWSSWAELFL